MRVYRNMQSRVTAVQKRYARFYLGKSLLSREAFYDWALNSPRFRELYSQWVASAFEIRLAPSVDRIDREIGYELGNIRWVTQAENSANTRRTKRTRNIVTPEMLLR